MLAISDYKSFGLCSNTLVKIVAVCDCNTLDSGHIKEALLAVYSLYTIALQNPFQELTQADTPLGAVQTSPISSRQFHTQVQMLVHRFNSSSNIAIKK